MEIAFPLPSPHDSGSEEEVRDAILLLHTYEYLHKQYYRFFRPFLAKDPKRSKYFPKALAFVKRLHQEGIQDMGMYVEGVLREFHRRHPERYCSIHVVLSEGGIRLYTAQLGRESSLTEVSSSEGEYIDKYREMAYNKIAPQVSANPLLRDWLKKRMGG